MNMNSAKGKIKLDLVILIDLQSQLCRRNDFDRVGGSISVRRKIGC